MSGGRWQALERALARLGVVAVLLWPLALLAFSVKDYVLPHGGAPAPHIDLEVYRAAARSFLDGDPLYGRTWPVGPMAAELPFTYPPFAAIVMTPMALLGVKALGLVWAVVSYLLLGAVLYGVARSVGERRAVAVACAVLGTGLGSFFTPMQSQLSLGQVNLVLMALVTADILVPHPRWPRGMLVGLAAAVKLTPAGFVLLFALRRDWRAVVTAGVSGVFWTFLAGGVAWRDSVDYWTSLLQSSDQVRVFSGEHSYSVHGILERLPLGPASTPTAVLAVLAILAVGALAIRRQLLDGALAMAVMVNAVVITLVSPVSWPHHWVWVVPTALVLALAAFRGSWISAALLAATVTAFVVGNAPSVHRYFWVAYVLWGLTFVLAATQTLVPRRSIDDPGALVEQEDLTSTLAP